MDFFTGAFATVVTMGGYLIAGGLYIASLFDKAKRDRELTDDQTATRLIQNLKTTSELQEKEITGLRKEKNEQSREIAHMSGQIKVLTEILQGRDPAMKAFLDASPELIRLATENHTQTVETAESINHLVSVLERFIERMDKDTPQPTG